MPFHSLEYALFFAVAVVAFYATPPRLRWATLLVAAAAFLGRVSPLHFVVALAFAGVNFVAALGIERWAESRRATLVLAAALLLDLGLLALFKYGAALSALWGRTLGLVGEAHGDGPWTLLVPLGISYYVFQLVGYLLEVYWGRAPATRHLGHLAACVLFFPKLVAGPIERPHHFLAQLERPRPFDGEDVAHGLRRMAWGLFKKCVIADRIALVIAPLFDAPRDFPGLPIAVAVGLYVVQIYCDFSGYTDLALGAARVLGLELQPNFDRPFAARSLSDFWRRWHISLSSWTNDYVFKPLSMSAASRTVHGGAATGLSIVVTFTVLGLWHGPRWGYLVFGLLHGAAVAVLALTQRRRQRLLRRLPPRLAHRLGQGATLLFYALSCVFFRANSVADGLYIVGHAWPGAGQLSPTGAHLLAQQQPQLALLAALGLIVVALRRWGQDRERLGWRLLAPRPRWQRWLVEYSLVAAILLLGVFDVPQFVYVQF